MPASEAERAWLEARGEAVGRHGGWSNDRTARGGHEHAREEEGGGVAALRMVRELGWDLEMQRRSQARALRCVGAREHTLRECVMHGCRRGLQTRLRRAGHLGPGDYTWPWFERDGA